MLKFEWDENKNKLNRKLHGLWFEEITSVFNDQNARFFLDKNHSDDESRYIIIGYCSIGRLLVVVHVFRENDVIRIISSRKATKKERLFYEKRI